MLEVHSPADETELLDREFRRLAEQVAAWAQASGFHVRPYRSAALPILNRLSGAGRFKALQSLKLYHDVCAEVIKSHGSLGDNRQVVWHAIRRLGLRPTSDLFQFLGERDVVEIHDRELVQIFRNLNFFHYCSYSLEDLHGLPWTALYERREPVQVELVQLALGLLSGQIKDTVPVTVVPHTIHELDSPDRLDIAAQIKFAAPLFVEGSQQVGATIVFEEGRIESSH